VLAFYSTYLVGLVFLFAMLGCAFGLKIGVAALFWKIVTVAEKRDSFQGPLTHATNSQGCRTPRPNSREITDLSIR
jgi:hypothetical protein